MLEKVPPAADRNKYREPQPDIMQYAHWKTLVYSTLNEMSPKNSSCLSSENPVEEEAEVYKSEMEWRTPKK